MKIMSRPRAGGKTHATVQWVKEAPHIRAMVVHDEKRKASLMREYDLTVDQIIVPSSAPRSFQRAVRIDDLEMFFNRIGFPYVNGFTTGPVEMI